MKCTDIFGLNDAIKKLAFKEMKRALEICGGKYVWEDSFPSIVANEGVAVEIYVKSVYEYNGMIKIEGREACTDEPAEAYLEDLPALDIMFLVEFMGEDDLGDASFPGFQNIVNDMTKELEKLK